jgi:hypothetical protein
VNKEIHDKFAKLVHDLMQGRIHNLDSNLIHAVLGIGTEAGEVQDLVKKNMFYNKPLDILTLKEECSNLLHWKRLWQ